MIFPKIIKFKKIFMKQLYKNIFFIILMLLFIQSCKNKESFVPELPPISSFRIDFSDFANNKTPLENTKNNWEYAVTKIGSWNILVTENIAIPILAYSAAISNHNQIYQGENIWLWEYTFKYEDSDYTAKLFGEVKEGNTTSWEMFISKVGEFKDFKWFTGEKFENDSVNWTVYNNPKDVGEILSINYSNLGLKYTNMVANSTENGSYIIYGENNNSDLNSFFTIYNNGKNNLTQIEWDRDNKNGRINDEEYFQNYNWHCWDENLEDYECNKHL